MGVAGRCQTGPGSLLGSIRRPSFWWWEVQRCPRFPRCAWCGHRHTTETAGKTFDLKTLYIVPHTLKVQKVKNKNDTNLFWLPAAAVHRLGADVLHVKAVDNFGAVFAHACVHLALLAALAAQVVADQETSGCSNDRHRHSNQEMFCTGRSQQLSY